MVLKNHLQSEGLFFVADETELAGLPKKLLFEIESFNNRNGVVEIGSRLKDRSAIRKCCPQCLKAHLCKKIKMMTLGKNVLRKLTILFDCEAGHDGFYLDGGKLIRI